eukprot:TRINITY_DN6629_c0_g1_i2.p1 TRINITY_DN6629_c0_g1~~TRINITY_DN6629_c0_g1_i2.p1  ORF type:complete len:1199 (+),score=319.29 TRINITY_DN6629_c0_g1_i2:96-3692(+)
MTRIQLWFIVIAGLLALGIPFLFIGLQLPNAMDAAILAKTAEYVILDEDDQDFWAVVPGRTQLDDMKMYFLFECTNPEEVATRNVAPEYREVGPFPYKYEHVLVDRKYISANGKKDSQVSFIKNFDNIFKGNEKDLEKEYPVINLAGIKRWASVKKKEKFELAIEGFFETFTFSKHHFVRDLANIEMSNHYKDLTNSLALTEGLDVSIDVRQAVCRDQHYGLAYMHNVYDWTLMCDKMSEKTEHEIYTYFGFSIKDFLTIRQRFCSHFIRATNSIKQKICSKIHDAPCTDYTVSFYQWFHGNLADGKSYADITQKKLFGIYEFSLFRKNFTDLLEDAYKRDFDDVKWDDKSYYFLLDTYHDHPDNKTGKDSLLLYDNMKRLFEAGRATHNPFKPRGARDDPGTTLDLSRFEFIAEKLKITQKQAFMLYGYFDYYVNNTVLLKDKGGDLEKERIGHYGAFVLKDVADYCEDYLDVVIYTRALSKHAAPRNCIGTMEFYFKVTENAHIIDRLANETCSNNMFDTDVSSPPGFKYFVEAASYPYGTSYNVLDAFYKSKVTEYTAPMLEAMIYGLQGPFHAQLDKIKKAVKAHYQSKSGDLACRNEFSPYCTKRQFFFSQLEGSYITSEPYRDADMTRTAYVADWRNVIRSYIDVKLVKTGVTPLPDQLIEVPIEMPYLEKHYGKWGIERKDLYDCMNFIEMYDTDVLFNLFLRLSDPGKLKSCRVFAKTSFYNSVKYLIREVQFGPMFTRLTPEAVFFGYVNRLLEVEHEYLDYLEGDDCTVDPWIGYSPKKLEDQGRPTPFDYLVRPIVMCTGAIDNSEIRKYVEYYGSPHAFHRGLARDITGDECAYKDINPFNEIVLIKETTDGMQYAQHAGTHPKGTTRYIMDQNVHRPLKLVKRNSMHYEHYGLEVDSYHLDLTSEHGCPDGVTFSHGIDMTSFYQYKAILSGPRFGDISEGAILTPKAQFTAYFDKEKTPPGYTPYESYYHVEPYTGITMQYYKKLMTSFVMYYDHLYVSPDNDVSGELLPYFSLYENVSVTKSFVDDLATSILSSRSTRRAVSITFTVLGLFFAVVGATLIIRACFFDPDEVLGDSEEPKNRADEAAGRAARLLPESESLQEETGVLRIGGTEEKMPEVRKAEIQPEVKQLEMAQPEVVQFEPLSNTQAKEVKKEIQMEDAKSQIMQPAINSSEIKNLDDNLLP